MGGGWALSSHALTHPYQFEEKLLQLLRGGAPMRTIELGRLISNQLHCAQRPIECGILLLPEVVVFF